MPPWFIVGTAAVFAYILSQLGKQREGEESEAGVGGLPGTGSGGGDGGGGGGGGLGDLPGYLPLQDAQQPSPSQQYGFGEAYAGSDSGGGEAAAAEDISSFDTFGTTAEAAPTYGPDSSDVISRLMARGGETAYGTFGTPSYTPAGTYADGVGYATTPSGELARSATGKPILE